MSSGRKCERCRRKIEDTLGDTGSRICKKCFESWKTFVFDYRKKEDYLLVNHSLSHRAKTSKIWDMWLKGGNKPFVFR